MNDVNSYTIVLPGKTMTISCPGFVTTIDVYSTRPHTSLRVYFLRELVNSRVNGTTRYEIVAQTEFQTNSVGIERHGLYDFISVRAGDVIALGYFEENPIPYTEMSRTCAKDNRCSWYHANSTAQMTRESQKNTTLSFEDTDVFQCRVYSIRVILQGNYRRLILTLYYTVWHETITNKPFFYLSPNICLFFKSVFSVV